MSGTGSIALLVLDVDGVLTDGAIHLDGRGGETKAFHARDGLGLRLWTRLGGEVAIVTGRTGLAVRQRATELGIRHVLLGEQEKAAALARVLAELNLPAAQAAVLGDDLPDLPMMRRVGYPMAVADAVDEVRAAAQFVTRRPGGRGAVREAVEHLLQSAGRWTEALALFG